MLDSVNLSRIMLKEEYKHEIEPLKERLSVLQHKVKENGVPVILLFEGWDTAGKGMVLSDIILTLDPRNFKTHSMLEPTTEEKREPFLWRHWKSIPMAGLFSIYDRSWYPELSYDRLEKDLDDKRALQRMDSVNMFERQMADNGALIIKIFLHITQKEQKRRLEKLDGKKSTAWQVNRGDYKRNARYCEYYRVFDEMLEYTNKPHAPWYAVSNMDKYAGLADVYRIIVRSIEQALAKQKEKAGLKQKSKPGPLSAGNFSLVDMPLLKDLKLDKALDRETYKQELAKGQKKLKKLHNHVYLAKVPVIIAYEGWDAAGKGGNIRRLTSALDPRGYEVIPIASPTPPEKNRQFLWRFWNALPKDGHIAIFDRTWYGRVLVERVEGFATPEEWQRAYREINEFERELYDWGAIILKFWLHIDKDEQLRRFEDRQNTPEKQWKITDEDWRNREKWAAYETAVNDMLRLTSTDFAPWTIIESQNKAFARIKTIDTVIAALEARL